jgi:trans-2,3-dihydro-3-hydroxyanthranilate isomerase
MGRTIRIVDVFTDKPLAGNQLAVVLDGRELSAELMQRIAREMNFSETTFVLPPDDPAHAARVRIFTPATELPFAGHPTIGTAWVLSDEGKVPEDVLEFTLEENVGPVAVRRAKDTGLVWMTHPPLTFGQVFPHAKVAAALGIDVSAIIHDIPAQVVSTGNPFLFVAFAEPYSVDRAVTDPARIRKLLKGSRAHGVFVFALTAHQRLYSRMFAVDIPEDPATGSAAGPLGAFAVRYGLIERAPKVSLLAEQGTKMGRQSFLHIELTYGDSHEIPEKIEVGGAVMPVVTGTLSDFD